MLIWASLTLWHMSTILSPFSSWPITSNFSSVLIVLCQFFTWIALGYVDLHFSFNTNAIEEETASAAWLYHQHNQSVHVTDGVTVMSLSASLLQKISVATNHLCQIVLNRKLSINSKSGVNFQGTWKWKCTKRNNLKRDLPICYSNM